MLQALVVVADLKVFSNGEEVGGVSFSAGEVKETEFCPSRLHCVDGGCIDTIQTVADVRKVSAMAQKAEALDAASLSLRY